MKRSFNRIVHHAAASGRCGTLIAAITSVLLPLSALAADQVDPTPDYTALTQHEHHVEHDSELVRKAHDANRKYADIRQALIVDNKGKKLDDPDRWVVGTPCVSGPDTGAMGIHIVRLSRAATKTVDFDAPTALIYEPQTDGHMLLVGLEYIQDAKAWTTNHPKGPGVPSLDGHLMNFVDAPNRYGLGAFYEIHVWAFEDNPKGAFADWNTHVTCEKQPFNFTVKP
jgi:hypothetical protein